MSLIERTDVIERLRHMANTHHAIKDCAAMEAAATQLEAMQAEIESKRGLLAKVLDYYEGRKPFDFHRLADDFDRSNQAFDAWQEIAGEIKTSLDNSKEGEK